MSLSAAFQISNLYLKPTSTNTRNSKQVYCKHSSTCFNTSFLPLSSSHASIYFMKQKFSFAVSEAKPCFINANPQKFALNVICSSGKEGLYPEPTPYESSGPYEPVSSSEEINTNSFQEQASTANQKDAEPDEVLYTLDLKRAPGTFKAISWTAWWVQLALILVSCVLVIFCISFTSFSTAEPGTGASSVSGSFLLTIISAILGLLSLFFTLSLTRIASTLEIQAYEFKSERVYDPMGLKARFRPVTAKSVASFLKYGVIYHLFGIGVSLLALQARVGLLLAEMLSSVGTRISNYGNAPVVLQNIVSPIDLFSVQALSNTLISLLIGLFLSLWLQLFYRRRVNPQEDSKTPK